MDAVPLAPVAQWQWGSGNVKDPVSISLDVDAVPLRQSGSEVKGTSKTPCPSLSRWTLFHLRQSHSGSETQATSKTSCLSLLRWMLVHLRQSRSGSEIQGTPKTLRTRVYRSRGECCSTCASGAVAVRFRERQRPLEPVSIALEVDTVPLAPVAQWQWYSGNVKDSLSISLEVDTVPLAPIVQWQWGSGNVKDPVSISLEVDVVPLAPIALCQRDSGNVKDPVSISLEVDAVPLAPPWRFLKGKLISLVIPVWYKYVWSLLSCKRSKTLEIGSHPYFFRDGQ